MQGVVDIAHDVTDICHNFHQATADATVSFYAVSLVGNVSFFQLVVATVDGIGKCVVVVTQLQELCVGKFQQVRHVEAAGLVINKSAVPCKIGNVVTVGEAVGKSIATSLLANRSFILQKQGHDVPFRHFVFEVINNKVFFKVGNTFFSACLLDGFQYGIQVLANFVFRHIFAGDCHIKIFCFGYVFFKLNTQDEADYTDVEDAGFNFSKISFTVDFQIVVAQFNKDRRIFKGNGFCGNSIQAQAGSNFITAGPQCLY